MEISQDLLGKFRVDKRAKYEFQVLGKEISDFTGKSAYHLFGIYHHQKIREAFEIAKKRGKSSLPYIIGIMKKLK